MEMNKELNIKAEMMKLTSKQRALMDALVNPQNRYKNVSRICQEIGIERRTYYNLMEKREFKDLYQKLTHSLVKDAIGPVINTFIAKAQEGSFQHGKVILEMAGVYNEKQEVSINGGLTFENGLRQLMDNDE